MSTVDVDGFVELVCADEELLRAEFDAIVAAGWPDDPPVPAARRPRGGPPRQPRPGTPPAPVPTAGGEPGPDPWARQRSPPDEAGGR